MRKVRMTPSALNATKHRYDAVPCVAWQILPRRSPEITRESIVGHPVSDLMRPTRFRNWIRQISQQKNSRVPSTSSQRFPQLESQIAQAV